jgi:hypothetical protein
MQILTIAESVGANSDASQEYTPSNGQEVCIRGFEANSKPNDNSYTVIEWGDDVGGWECLWAIWDSEPMNHMECRTGDGTKKVRLRAINNESSATMMSGRVEIT